MTARYLNCEDNSCSTILKLRSLFYFICALIIYLPSTALLPASAYYIIAICVLVNKFIFDKSKLNLEFYLLISFFIISLIVSLSIYFCVSFFSGPLNLDYKDNFIPLQLSLVFSLILASVINERIAFFIVICILLECFAGIVQFGLGIKTFFSFVDVELNESGISSGLLYFKRVYGFCSNSSGFAGNILIMLTLTVVYLKNISKAFALFVLVVGFVAIIVSFTRSAIIAYTLLVILFLILNMKITFTKFSFLLLFSIGLFLLTLYLYDVDLNAIIEQLNRGKKGQDLSGRDLIWYIYLDNVSNNFMWGNFSLRNYLYIPVFEYMHAHNSFLMVFYTVGIIPAVLIFAPIFFICALHFKKNLPLIGLFVFSMMQYFIFWGASFADIVFFAVLLNSKFIKLQYKIDKSIMRN